jgi:membrane protein required for colicin V production
MNGVDVVVAIAVALAGLRGYFRGFLRELFGLLALGGGIVAAVQWGGAASALIGDAIPGPQVIRDGVAFVAVFVGAHVLINLTGFLLDRLAAALLLGGVNRVVGAMFGGAKATAVAAVVLLFVHLFPPFAALDEQIMTSSIGRPLVAAASGLLRLGLPRQAEQGR